MIYGRVLINSEYNIDNTFYIVLGYTVKGCFVLLKGFALCFVTPLVCLKP